jgi:hypothetical protein
LPASDGLRSLRQIRQAAIRFCNSGTVEQVAILNNTILLTGGPQTAAASRADGILFDIGIIEIRDLLIDSNVIHQNTRNGIKFDYVGRLGENVVISNNAKGVQGITQNGPAPTRGPARRGQRHLHHQPGERGPRRPVRQ